MMPKEEDFFRLLGEATDNLVKAARMLVEFAAEEDEEKRQTLADEIDQIEHDGDRITRQIFEKLAVTFVTPLALAVSTAWTYPIDGLSRSGIRRLETYRLAAT